jgi:NADPH:quinone reductase-like Zn-dependent oxidoreductase
MIEVPEPSIRSRDVLIRVSASTINIDDIHFAEGTFYGGLPIGPRPKPHAPVIPGSDVAGVVVGVGHKVRSVQVGERVFGVHLPFSRGGAWAEFCAVDERWITKKPECVSFDDAAASGVSGLVALIATNALKIRTGSMVVILGITGGIGTIAAQLAIRAGGELIGVCGPGNIDRAYRLGCSLALDYRSGRWGDLLRVKGIPSVDRVLDLVGGCDNEEMGRQVLKRDGIFVTVVGPQRFVGDQALGWTGILANLAHVAFLTSSSLLRGPRYILTGPGLRAGRELSVVAGAASAGVLPTIDSIVPFELSPIREALHRAVAHLNNGRIVIQVSKLSPTVR